MNDVVFLAGLSQTDKENFYKQREQGNSELYNIL